MNDRPLNTFALPQRNPEDRVLPRYTQAEIAKAAGVSRTVIYKLERSALRKLRLFLAEGYNVEFKEELLGVAESVAPDGWVVRRFKSHTSGDDVYRFISGDYKRYVDVHMSEKDERTLCTIRAAEEFFKSPLVRAGAIANA